MNKFNKKISDELKENIKDINPDVWNKVKNEIKYSKVKVNSETANSVYDIQLNQSKKSNVSFFTCKNTLSAVSIFMVICISAGILYTVLKLNILPQLISGTSASQNTTAEPLNPIRNRSYADLDGDGNNESIKFEFRKTFLKDKSNYSDIELTEALYNSESDIFEIIGLTVSTVINGQQLTYNLEKKISKGSNYEIFSLKNSSKQAITIVTLEDDDTANGCTRNDLFALIYNDKENKLDLYPLSLPDITASYENGYKAKISCENTGFSETIELNKMFYQKYTEPYYEDGTLKENKAYTTKTNYIYPFERTIHEAYENQNYLTIKTPISWDYNLGYIKSIVTLDENFNLSIEKQDLDYQKPNIQTVTKEIGDIKFTLEIDSDVYKIYGNYYKSPYYKSETIFITATVENNSKHEIALLKSESECYEVMISLSKGEAYYDDIKIMSQDQASNKQTDLTKIFAGEKYIQSREFIRCDQSISYTDFDRGVFKGSATIKILSDPNDIQSESSSYTIDFEIEIV